MQTYEELHNGRFAILADFEDPNHIQLAKVIGVSSNASCRINAKKGSKQPGSSALAFSFGSPDDTLTLSNEQANDWYLKRDWRGFDLLMMNVETVQLGLLVDLTIGAGQPSAKQQVHSSFRLDQGSNTLRIDLAELAERIPLDDVRVMLFSISGANNPTEVYFDDLLLASNGQDIFGDSTKSDGRLYVRTAGKRTKVGAGGRFELTFANGQIVEWFDLASDPSRLHNRVAGTTLTPMPVFADYHAYKIGKASFTPAWTSNVNASQTIVEMNDVRVIVQCNWGYSDRINVADSQPTVMWTYAMYPTGQVYVSFVAPELHLYRTDFSLGMAVGLSTAESSTFETSPDRIQSNAPTQQYEAWAGMIDSDDELSFLWVPDASSSGSTFQMLDDESEDTKSLFLPFPRAPGQSTWHWTSQFCVSLSPSTTRELAKARAFDFATPTTPVLEQGQYNQPANQPESWGPFNRGLGQYSITPDRGRVRMIIDQREHRMFSPAFEIRDSANAEVWVYLNHLVVKNTARNIDGNVIFQLPADLPKRSTMEVIVRRE